MAPKRSRGESSGSYDSHKFVSLDASLRYHNNLLKRTAVKERGLEPERINSIILNIQNRGWGTFTKQPEAAVLPVVREFYANAPEHNNNQVWVRGKWIAVDRTAINRYYRLPNVHTDQYSAFLEREDKWEVVLEYLALPNTEWKRSGGSVSSLPSKTLTRDSKAWHYFVGAKLMPVTHFSDIHRDRAALVYAIQNNLTVDVGKIIRTEILRCASNTNLGLYFPSLITALCGAAGVKWENNEEWVPPLPLIDFNQYFHMKERDEAAPGAAPRLPAQPQAAPPPAPAQGASPPPVAPEAASQAHPLHSISAAGQLQGIRNQLNRIRSWFINLEHRQHNWERHQTQVNEAIGHSLSLLMDSAGVDPSRRPVFPRWEPEASSSAPAQEASDEDSDEGDDGDDAERGDEGTDPMTEEED